MALGQQFYTANSILLNCVDFMALGEQFFTANSMHELFTKVKQENIWEILSAAILSVPPHIIFLANHIIISRNNSGTF